MTMYVDMESIKRANRLANHHWFSPGTLAFFESRVVDTVWPVSDGAYFVSSEKGPSGPRAYSVRFADARGHISTYGEFMGYRTLERATEAAALAAASHTAAPAGTDDDTDE